MSRRGKRETASQTTESNGVNGWADVKSGNIHEKSGNIHQKSGNIRQRLGNIHEKSATLGNIHHETSEVESSQNSENGRTKSSPHLAHSRRNKVEDMEKVTTGGISSYVVALRPWSFTASLTPVALGSCLAYKILGSFNPWIFITTCLTALSVHAAGNLVNTYFDYKTGVDCSRSDDRTLVDSLLSPNDVATMGAVCYCMGCAGFVVLVWLSPAPMEHLALIYFGGLSGSFLYTGGLGLKYMALGDVIVFLVFGPVTVLFAFMSQGGQLSWTPLLYAVPLALNTEAILHSNNARDMDVDRAAGIHTLAIMLGEMGSYVLFAFLLFSPYVIFSILAIHWSRLYLLPLLTVFIAFDHERSYRQRKLARLPNNIAKLNLLLGILYVVTCALTPVRDLPGF